jgi:anti-sigma regulatory factor (Ser/Thr protein kinase)
MEALAHEPQHRFRHEALFYAGQEEFLDGTAAFIREGVESGQPALVVLSAPKIEALRAELDGDADRVLFADMAEVGANPARIIPAWREFAAEHSGPIRGIGEPIWAERSAAELVECQHHESLLNLAFADRPGFYLLCPYDIAALGPEVLVEARRSHPFLSVNGADQPSSDYRGLEAVAAPFGDPLPDPPVQPRWRVFGVRGLAGLRDFVSAQASDTALSADATEDLELAVHEVAANSVTHGGGGGALRVWVDGGAVICEITDKGIIDEPLVGRERPRPGQAGGCGLWMANQLCDLVQVRTSAHGTTVRMHKLIA